MNQISFATFCLLLTSSYALYFQPQSSTQTSNILCQGTYYQALNALFVDCYDQYGNLVSEDQSFYEFSLDSQCNAVAYSDIQQSLLGWQIPQTVTNSTQLNCCDFFQRTVGYVFTQCDNNIGAVVLADRVNSSMSNQYMQMTQQYKYLDWDWTQLVSLIQTYCQQQQGGQQGGQQSSQNQSQPAKPINATNQTNTSIQNASGTTNISTTTTTNATQQQPPQQSQSQSSQPPVTSGNIPVGLEQIVAWISQQVDREIRMNCSAQCQQGNKTQVPVAPPIILPPVNQTNVSAANVTQPISNASGGEFNPMNYKLPSTCQFNSSDNSTVCCTGTSGQSSCFTFAELNQWYTTTNIQSVCSQLTNWTSTCSSNSTVAQCEAQQAWTWFQSQHWQDIYGWLAVDTSYQDHIFNQCGAVPSSMQTDWQNALTYAFGNITPVNGLQ